MTDEEGREKVKAMTLFGLALAAMVSATGFMLAIAVMIARHGLSATVGVGEEEISVLPLAAIITVNVVRFWRSL